jgi:hypothetical protein
LTAASFLQIEPFVRMHRWIMDVVIQKSVMCLVTQKEVT